MFAVTASARAAPAAAPVTLRAASSSSSSSSSRGVARVAPRGSSVRSRAFGFGKESKKTEEAAAEDEDDEDDADDADGEGSGIDFKGLKQLISMGLGTISGDITEINFDKENASRAVVMELEANNFEDAEGNPLWKPDDVGFVGDAEERTPIMNYVVPVVLGVGAIGGVVATLNAL
jgi:hypothetical protein